MTLHLFNRDNSSVDNGGMRALSIRQPYAELILRGTCGQQIKPIELRSRPTRIIGERFYICANFPFECPGAQR
jgi:hypothetical protein